MKTNNINKNSLILTLGLPRERSECFGYSQREKELLPLPLGEVSAQRWVRVFLVLLLLTGLSACKIELNLFGDGKVQSESGNFDCQSVDGTQSGDCTQTYNTDSTSMCDPTDADCTLVIALRTDPAGCPNGSTWAAVYPTCRYPAATLADCDTYDANDTAKDEWMDDANKHCIHVVSDLTQCWNYTAGDTWHDVQEFCTLENYIHTDTLSASTPDGDGTVSLTEANGACLGTTDCDLEVSNANANNTGTATVEVHFDEPAPQAATYTYNYLGQRVSKTIGSTTTYYIYDQSGHLLTEIDKAASETASAAVGKNYVYAEGELVASVDLTNSAIEYPVNDQFGRPIVSLDYEHSFVTSETNYEPFGKRYAAYNLASIAGVDSLKQNQGLPGQYYDEETGYYDNWMRTYDSTTGRYISSDPIGLAGGINTYGYAYQNPVMYYDPDGRLVVTATGSIESTAGPVGRGGSSGVYADFTNGSAGGITTTSKTTGLLADVGGSIDVYSGDANGVAGRSTTIKICLLVGCINIHQDSSGNFFGIGAGPFAGTETGFGGGFSHHQNDTNIQPLVNLPQDPTPMPPKPGDPPGDHLLPPTCNETPAWYCDEETGQWVPFTFCM